MSLAIFTLAPVAADAARETIKREHRADTVSGLIAVTEDSRGLRSLGVTPMDMDTALWLAEAFRAYARGLPMGPPA